VPETADARSIDLAGILALPETERRRAGLRW
jgi:hypothetical protein